MHFIFSLSVTSHDKHSKGILIFIQGIHTFAKAHPARCVAHNTISDESSEGGSVSKECCCDFQNDKLGLFV